jgi:hypothetical protein
MRLPTLLFATFLSLFSFSAQAWRIFGDEPVRLWDITFVSQTRGDCASEMTFDWPGSGVRSNLPEKMSHYDVRYGRGWKICDTYGGSRSSDSSIDDNNMLLSWVDSDGVHHSAEIPVKKSLSAKTLYGGTLVVQFKHDSVAVLVEEPDKPRCTKLICPRKPAVQIYP